MTENAGQEDLEVRTTQVDDVCVIAFAGELNVFNLKKAEAAVAKVIHNGRANVVFDLSGRSCLVIGLAGALMLASSVAALFFREYRRFLSGAAEPIAKVTIAA